MGLKPGAIGNTLGEHNGKCIINWGYLLLGIMVRLQLVEGCNMCG
jgi:hypothetical protein